MMSKEFLKKLGIVGITVGLSASPLAFADFHDEEDDQGAVPQETVPGEDAGAGAGTDAAAFRALVRAAVARHCLAAKTRSERR